MLPVAPVTYSTPFADHERHKSATATSHPFGFLGWHLSGLIRRDDLPEPDLGTITAISTSRPLCVKMR
jgi:hypothetical protein